MQKSLSKTLAILCSTALVCAFSMLSISMHAPAVYSPFSLPSVIPALALSILDLPHLLMIFLGVLPLSLIFLVCMVRGSAKNIEISNAAVLIITSVAFFAVLFIASRFQAGIEYQGLTYTLTISALNLIFIMGLPIMFWRYRARPSLLGYLGFYTVFFIWLGFSAFPWLGELI